MALRYLKSIIRDKVLKAALWWRHGGLCSKKPDIVESCVNEVSVTTGQICSVYNQTVLHLLKLNQCINVSHDLG